MIRVEKQQKQVETLTQASKVLQKAKEELREKLILTER